MSYIRDPIYIIATVDGNIICYTCHKIVGTTSEDAYKHMIKHAIEFNKNREYLKADIVELNVQLGMIQDILLKNGSLTHDEYREIVKKIIDWESEGD